MTTELPDIRSKVRIDTSDLERAVGRASRHGSAIGSALGSAVGTMAGAGLGRALGAVKAFTSGAVNNFAAVEDATGAAGVQFDRNLPKVLNFAEHADKAFGLSKRAALDAENTFGTLGKAAGLQGPKLADFSIKLTGLAGDLASFKGTSTEQAINAVGAALRGESEPLRAYGVLLDENTLKAEALSMGLLKPTKNLEAIKTAQVRATLAQLGFNKAVREHGKNSVEAMRAGVTLTTAQQNLAKQTAGSTGTLTTQQKVLAAQSAILKQTGDAQGDYARTSTSTANTQKTLAAEAENASAELGEALAPAVTYLRREAIKLVEYGTTHVVPVLKEFTEQFQNNEGAGGDVRDVFEGIRDAAGGLWSVARPVLEFFAHHPDLFRTLATGAAALAVGLQAQNLAAGALARLLPGVASGYGRVAAAQAGVAATGLSAGGSGGLVGGAAVAGGAAKAGRLAAAGRFAAGPGVGALAAGSTIGALAPSSTAGSAVSLIGAGAAGAAFGASFGPPGVIGGAVIGMLSASVVQGIKAGANRAARDKALFEGLGTNLTAAVAHVDFPGIEAGLQTAVTAAMKDIPDGLKNDIRAHIDNISLGSKEKVDEALAWLDRLPIAANIAKALREAKKAYDDADLENSARQVADATIRELHRGGVQGANSYKAPLLAGLRSAGVSASELATITGYNIAEGLIAGMRARELKVRAIAGELGAVAANAARHGAEVFSPSRITTYVGEMIGEGLIVGMDRRRDSAARAARNLAELTAGALVIPSPRVTDFAPVAPGRIPTQAPVAASSAGSAGPITLVLVDRAGEIIARATAPHLDAMQGQQAVQLERSYAWH